MSTESREEEKELRSIVLYPTNNVLETKAHKHQICRAAKENTLTILSEEWWEPKRL